MWGIQLININGEAQRIAKKGLSGNKPSKCNVFKIAHTVKPFFLM